MLDRFFVSRARANEIEAEAAMWRKAYDGELNRRLDAELAASDARHCAFLDALTAERLRSLIAKAHFRNPETGRLSPRGVFPAEELN